MIETIDNYEIYFDKFLGEGQYGQVYLGKYIGESNEYIEPETTVAIKICAINKNDKDIIKRELDNLKIVRKDPHINLIKYYEDFRYGKNIYIIFEYCENGNMKSILNKELCEGDIKCYFYQILSGINHLSKIGIMHRDIKPSNILLTNNYSTIKITDFGLSKSINIIDIHGTFCGSPSYMAPEIMGYQHYSNQVDMWSAGLILYEMIYGHHPYSKIKNLKDLKNEMDNYDINISNNIKISEECIDLLKKILVRDQKKRICIEEAFKHQWIQTNKKYEITMVGNKEVKIINDYIENYSYYTINNEKQSFS